jgi:hypothetical protein
LRLVFRGAVGSGVFMVAKIEGGIEHVSPFSAPRTQQSRSGEA